MSYYTNIIVDYLIINILNKNCEKTVYFFIKMHPRCYRFLQGILANSYNLLYFLVKKSDRSFDLSFRGRLVFTYFKVYLKTFCFISLHLKIVI